MKQFGRSLGEVHGAVYDDHDTAVAVIVGEGTSDFVLIRSRRTGLWRFPGDRVRGTDAGADRETAAEHAAMRIIKERTGLAPRLKRIMVVSRPFGLLFGFIGLADFKQFAPRDDENTTMFPLGEIPLHNMSPPQKMAFDEAVRWIRE